MASRKFLRRLGEKTNGQDVYAERAETSLHGISLTGREQYHEHGAARSKLAISFAYRQSFEMSKYNEDRVMLAKFV